MVKVGELRGVILNVVEDVSRGKFYWFGKRYKEFNFNLSGRGN